MVLYSYEGSTREFKTETTARKAAIQYIKNGGKQYRNDGYVAMTYYTGYHGDFMGIIFKEHGRFYYAESTDPAKKYPLNTDGTIGRK